MPRNLSGDYSLPAGSVATSNTTISSAAYNAVNNDLASDANTARPIKYGGTGGGDADTALTNLGFTATGKAISKATSPTDAQNISGAQLPAGAIQHFVLLNAPTGWLKANGQAVSRTTYAALFAAIGTSFGAGDGATTFNVPDFRGEFIRAWDDGRGVDASRAMGSAQPAAMLDHTHTVSGVTSTDPGHTHGAIVASGGGGTTTLTTTPGAPTPNGGVIQSGGAHSHTFSAVSGTGSAGGGPETRPRNVALLVCIKY